MTILFVGIATLDMVFGLDQSPEPDAKQFAQSYSAQAGGIATNAAIAAHKLGGRVRLASLVGDDLAGKEICAQLEDQGLQLDDVRIRQGFASPISSVVLHSTGQRQLVNYKQPNFFDVDFRVAPDLKPQALMVDTRWFKGASQALAQFSKAIRVLDYDSGTPDAEGHALLEAVSHTIFAKAAFRDLKQGWWAYTDGASGTVSSDGSVPAFEIEAVDSNGAGDVFHGAFTLSLAEGKTEHDALVFASAAAAIKCSRHGGWRTYPDRKDVDEFLKERGISC